MITPSPCNRPTLIHSDYTTNNQTVWITAEVVYRILYIYIQHVRPTTMKMAYPSLSAIVPHNTCYSQCDNPNFIAMLSHPNTFLYWIYPNSNQNHSNRQFGTWGIEIIIKSKHTSRNHFSFHVLRMHFISISQFIQQTLMHISC